MALVEVVGMGFVGLTTAVVAAESGHSVVGIERDANRLQLLKRGILPFSEPNLQDAMRSQMHEGNLTFADLSYAAEGPAVLIVATPTPTRSTGVSDVSSVQESLERFWVNGRHDLVMIRSTLLPGTINEMLSCVPPALSHCVVHWPEFLNQGRALTESRFPDRIVIGVDTDHGAVAARHFLNSLRIHGEMHILPVKAAEAVKHFSNAALAVNQVLGAEIAAHCEALGVHPGDVLTGVAADSRLDVGLLRPRVPLVDSCLRKDLLALTGLLSQRTEPELLQSTLGVAEKLHTAAVGLLKHHVHTQAGTQSTLIIGAGFTGGVSDTSGSLVWEIMDELGDRGELRVWDPYVGHDAPQRLRDIISDMPLEELLADASVIALLVAHPEVTSVDWEKQLPYLSQKGVAIVDFCDFFDHVDGLAGGPAVIRSFGVTQGRVNCVA